LAVAQNGPAPPTSSALTITRLFRVVIDSSNARAARFASVGFQRASWVLGSAGADVINHRIAEWRLRPFCPAALSVATKQASNFLTDQGGERRRSLTKFPLRDLLLSKG
jgi:hypothetical protein